MPDSHGTDAQGKPLDSSVPLAESLPPLADAPRSARLSSVVGRLAIVNVAISVAGLVSGPLQARALGAHGRGELAAIVVPLTLTPMLLSLALGAYVAREAASGRRTIQELTGSVGIPLLVMTVIGMVAAIPLVPFLADGNSTVQTYLTVGYALLPLSMAGTVLVPLIGGLERWSLLIFMRAIPVAIPFVAIVVMYALDQMTVGRVVMATLAGGILSILPAVAVVVRAGWPVVQRATARASVSFGLRSWAGGLAQIANVRLDQLLMITLVGYHELGLYAVAVTLSNLSSFVGGALSPPLIARVAQGQTALVPRALRVMLAAVGGMNLAAAAATPFLLPAVFGAEFADAVDQAIVLLAANVLLTGTAVLAAALAADGAPGKSSIGQGIGLLITLPGLFLLVPSLGGLGAAAVSLVAYGVSFSYQLFVIRRRLGGSLRSYLFPQAEDARWAMSLILSRHRPT